MARKNHKFAMELCDIKTTDSRIQAARKVLETMKAMGAPAQMIADAEKKIETLQKQVD